LTLTQGALYPDQHRNAVKDSISDSTS